MTTRLAEIRARARSMLAAAGFADPAAEADALLAGLRGCGRGDVQLDCLLGRSVGAAEGRRLLAAAGRRARREPLQHITGRAHFLEHELEVGPGVFVPRPETEGLVLAAEARMRTILTTVPGAAEAGVLDAGSGSGAIAIGLASRLAGSGTRVTALEGSPHAWPYLLRNVARSGLPIEPRFGRIGDPRPLGGARYALIASNPPYIPEACLPVDPEVRLFDPEPALYSGPDGLDAVRVLVRFAARRLLPGGAILLEHDERQGRSVRALLDGAGLVQSRTEADLNGRDRVSSALRAR